ncbi:hypothetical protein HS7_13670 [Sulfolobales archaeon HS-7]|nr:hypothetical protein HS7_13670 [Sulfolobales archaeon HS-7]
MGANDVTRQIINNPELIEIIADRVKDKIKDEVVIKKLEENSQAIISLEHTVREFMKEVKDSLSSLQRTVEQHSVVIEKHSEAIASLQKSVEQHSVAIENLTREMTNLQRTVEQHSVVIEKHSEAIASLQKSVEQHSVAIENLTREMTNLQRTVEQHSVVIEKHSEAIASLQKSVEQHSVAIENLTREMTNLQRTVEQHSVAIENLTREMTNLQRTVEQHSVVIEKHSEAIASLQKSVEQHSVAIENLTREMTNLQRTVEQHSVVIEKHSEAIASLQKAVEELVWEQRKLSTEIGSFTNRAGLNMERTMLSLYKKALELHGVNPEKVQHGKVIDTVGVIEKGRSFEVDFYETNDYVYVFEIKNLADEGAVEQIFNRKKLFSALYSKPLKLFLVANYVRKDVKEQLEGEGVVIITSQVLED